MLATPRRVRQAKPNDSLRRSSRISDAKKAADKRENIDKRRPPMPQVFRAYVGNIHPLTSVSELTKCFETCDGLSEISLRISHGCAVQATPDMLIDDLDVQYATITLTQWSGLVQVMKMNGMTLTGRRLVIGLTSAILPEMDRIFFEHYHGVGALRRKKYGGGTLRPEPTEVIHGETNQSDLVIWKMLTPLCMPITLM
ncbi:hypothetical protein F5878DRAFT_246970 [Lentinula raphanica]|uniref:RRM domain-containing protein n=1 Tax=Lentinula raphanica TaxID=153919 RepID=A0AA38P5M6_9AGAR|nr:hypothetical protein F5878DRAFT_246970 [Lentinula raphanica]